jgi:hypothetical protein
VDELGSEIVHRIVDPILSARRVDAMFLTDLLMEKLSTSSSQFAIELAPPLLSRRTMFQRR